MIFGGKLRGFGARFFLAQVLVIVAGAATLTVVAFAVAPGIFRSHIRSAAAPLTDETLRHIDEAFSDAVLIALGLAIGSALVAAVAMNAFLAMRVARPVRDLTNAAQDIARGISGVRAPVGGSGEISELGVTFNHMAEALESSEKRRRVLLSDVAHELRTPLATMMGYIEGLRDGVIVPGQAAWQVLDAEAKRMHRLVEDLSLVSQAEERQLELRLEATDPGTVVTNAVAAARARYTVKGVQLGASVTPGLPNVFVDPERLGGVLASLLDNALRHTPSGGKVHVEVTRCERDIEIVVEDTGDGVPPEYLDRIFERFFRTDMGRSRAAGGSGIGLTIARAIVQSMGGRMAVTSEGLGKGARFTIRLPSVAGSRRAHARVPRRGVE